MLKDRLDLSMFADPSGDVIVTLSDEELDVVSAGATSFVFSVTSTQTGNTFSNATITANVQQGNTAQNVSISGNFTTG